VFLWMETQQRKLQIQVHRLKPLRKQRPPHKTQRK
jgi:hypothetical protein